MKKNQVNDKKYKGKNKYTMKLNAEKTKKKKEKGGFC